MHLRPPAKRNKVAIRNGLRRVYGGPDLARENTGTGNFTGIVIAHQLFEMSKV
jgi:hypothetical protein